MKTSSDLKKIIKDSLFTGLISLALFGPIVGLKTSSKGEGLFVTLHIGIVVLLVAACIVGRFLIGLNSLRKKEINFIANITSSISRYMDNKGRHVAITGVLFAIVFPFLPFTDRYVLDVFYYDFNLHHAGVGVLILWLDWLAYLILVM